MTILYQRPPAVETDPATPLIQAIRYYEAWSLVNDKIKDKDSLNRPRDRTYSGNQALILQSPSHQV